MTTVHAQLFGDKALIPRADLERLVKLAEQSEPVVLQIDEEDVPTVGLARLAEQGGSFDFWQDQGEEIYSEEDGEPV
jgi:hypothetical protein